ncbi:MAG: ribonuclease III domain-containing protein [Cyanobacteriota bacterium]|nr:ribonuclease III domain-containing protein [Cyanobacteriota bacterium]
MAGLSPNPPLDELGALQLAWLGDAVWELHQRQIRCRRPARAHELHRQVVGAVRAAAQAEALQGLQGLLSQAEQDLVRRGRNRAGRGPRAADPAAYAQATGFEALLGWLFLHNPPRLVELLDHLQAVNPDSFTDPLP